MSAGEYGHKPRNGIRRARIFLHTKLKYKNRHLLNIIKHERSEKAALLERIQQYEEASAKAEVELTLLKAQLVAVKAALNQTSSNIEDGLASFHLANLRFQELNEGINKDCPNLGSIEKGTVVINQPPTASTTATLALVPPPKLQARVNPMVQGVPLMSPSIMLQRLQPDDLERQLSSTQRAVSATTPISPSVHEASVPTLTEAGQTSRHNRDQQPGGPHGVQPNSAVEGVDPGTQLDPGLVRSLRRSTRLRRM